MSEIPVSVQLYSIRDEMKSDLPGSLRRVAEIGYRNVELAGFGGATAAEFKSLLDECGLKATSAHVGFDAFSEEEFGKTLAEYGSMGCTHLIVPHRAHEQSYEAAASALESIGTRLRPEGFRIGYHNHNAEFEPNGSDKIAIDVLMDGTSPDLVSFELDTFWALYAHQDPIEFLERRADRIDMLHLKDMRAQDREFAALGTGILPLDGLLAAARKAPGIAYLVVEQDQADEFTTLEGIAIAYKTLSQKGYK